jgi:hypothetical protein
MPIYPLQRVFTPKIVGIFYMQGYKVKEKTAIVPPVSKLSGHPDTRKHAEKLLIFSETTWNLPFYFLLLMSHFQVPIANFFPKRNER